MEKDLEIMNLYNELTSMLETITEENMEEYMKRLDEIDLDIERLGV